MLHAECGASVSDRTSAGARVVTTALCAALLTTTLVAAPVSAQRTGVVVSSKWLASRLSDPTVVVLHAAQSRAEYDAGHLPGARYLPLTAVAVSAGGLSTQMPAAAVIDSVLEAAGVSDGQQVVVYGQPLAAARAFVTLEYAGLRGRASVLDGGIDAWREAGRPVVHDEPAPRRGTFTLQIDSTVVADIAFVAANTDRSGGGGGGGGGVKVLDARAPEFYLGYSPGQMPRAGHIPGAGNVPFSSLTGELTTLRDEGKVRKLFAAAGARAGDTVVTYCHIGLQASLLYLNARRLGYNARIFDGSFEEWSKRSDLPVVVEATGRPR